MLSTGAVVVTATAEEPPASLLADGRDEATLARQAEERAALVRTEQLRSEAVEVASGAIEQASAVRAEAEQVAVAPEVIAELDAATAELQAAIASVDVAPLTPTDALADRDGTVSRSAQRDGGAEDGGAQDDGGTPTASPTTDAASPTASADPTAVPADPAAEAAAAAPADPAADATLTGQDPATATVPDSGDPATEPLREALERVARASDAAKASAEQKRAEAAAAQAAADEAARAAAEQAAKRAAWKASLQGFDNGQVPESALCGVSFAESVRLRCDAAESLDALDAAFAARFGKHLQVSDSYRSYSQQVACRANKGSLCARPGTSNHGMGVAVDLGGAVQSFGTAEHVWMRENAPAHDWTLPEWARAGGSKPEPWHWEYVG
ncbi:D-alanyl-D-alanine carboxypeptidase family protein [Cellulomonas sp. 179-A 9B4 NHS]|uniref:D-alanyl-D-alanine carboxypeptidase family protein n=1 Tax=Cellulomonas sp. 179-A 9B4 NHS TaxID=3142379 RepID=UPI0039A2BC45